MAQRASRLSRSRRLAWARRFLRAPGRQRGASFRRSSTCTSRAVIAVRVRWRASDRLPARGDRKWELRSYVAIRSGAVVGRAGPSPGLSGQGVWGHWWVWSDPTPGFVSDRPVARSPPTSRLRLRGSERQARYASVFAIVCGRAVELHRGADGCREFVYPRVLTLTGGRSAGPLRVSLLGLTLLYVNAVEVRDGGKEGRTALAPAAAAELGEDAVRPLRSAAPLHDRSALLTRPAAARGRRRAERS